MASPSYASFVDPQLLTANICADYENEARLMNAGVLSVEGLPEESSQVGWVSSKLFADDDAGQAIGVNSEINLKSVEQTEYALPLVQRANGAVLDDVYQKIISKATAQNWTDEAVADAIHQEVQSAITANAGQIYDTGLHAILGGCGKYMEANTLNYNDAGTDQIDAAQINTTMSKRGEKGSRFADNGILICTGLAYHKLVAQGLVANSNTIVGQSKADRINESGDYGKILGMNILPSDKITATSDTDEYCWLLEPGALRVKRSGVMIDPVQRRETQFQDIVKYMIRFGGIVNGLSWSASKTNVVTNTDLATATNYKTGVENAENIPFAVLRIPAPSL